MAATLALAAALVSAASAEPDPPPPDKDQRPAHPAPDAAGKGDGKAPEKGEDDKAVSEVEVVAERPAVVKQIDRQIYDVRKDPEAQTASVSDILGKIPSVTVTPTGGVLLLGQSGVTILVDGKPGSTRALRGADIERVEVMTNPSAQYGPRGTAGIINIVTRKDRRQGQTGSVTAGIDSDGGYRFSLGPNWVMGRWIVAANIGAGQSDFSSSFERLRRQDDGLGGMVTIREGGRNGYAGEDLQGGLKATFRRNDRQSVYAGVQLYRSEGQSDGRERATADTAAFDAYSQRTRGPGLYEGGNINLGYDWTGKTEGETFSLALSANPWSNEDTTISENRYDNPALPDLRILQRNRQVTLQTELKADYKRPLSGDRILSLGGAWTREDEDRRQTFETLTAPDPLRDQDRSISGLRDTQAAYVTYQFPLWTWTLMPGLRVEYEAFDVQSGGAFGGSDHLFWYPSLHVGRDFGDDLKLGLSYSRRIDVPDLTQLDPAIRYYDPTSASRGNPNLQPVTTDAWEARLDYTNGAFSAGLVVYDRESSGTISGYSVLTPDGVRLSTVINAGQSANRGAEVSLRGKVATNWSYAVTTNLFWREQQVLVGGAPRTDSQFSYSGNAQFSWKANPAKPDSGDQVQLGLRYLGPTRNYQGSSDGFLRADLTWKHPVTKKLMASLTISDLLDSSESHSTIRAAGYDQDSTYRGSGPTARVFLTYRFGAP
ncbi:MAG: TonB-dependent receptor [Caulobacter sp.]|nr:TonB-dependent receptor [Caulobacter sp.]